MGRPPLARNSTNALVLVQRTSRFVVGNTAGIIGGYSYEKRRDDRSRLSLS